MGEELTTISIKKKTYADLVDWINHNMATPKDTTFNQAVEQILLGLEVFDDYIKLFILWNEKYGISEQAFAEKTVTMLGSKYIKKSAEVAGEQNE